MFSIILFFKIFILVANQKIITTVKIIKKINYKKLLKTIKKYLEARIIPFQF